MNADELGVGDILCTRSKGWIAFLIRLWAALVDMPNLVNHVIILHHRNPDGGWVGIEARPGGVGWRDITPGLLRSPYLSTNAAQPKTEQQRFLIAKAAEELLRLPYDYAGIVMAGFEGLHINIWDPVWGPVRPHHVFCSAAAAWCYGKVGLAAPGLRFDRLVTPGAWDDWNRRAAWTLAA